MKEIEISIDNFSDAVSRLEEGIQKAKDELARDGVIQRFEFTFELFWKTLKLILNFEGIACNTPRNCIKEAFRNEMIVESEIYLDMLDDRNRSSHIYDETTSKEIFERIKTGYLSKLKKAEKGFHNYYNQT